MGRGLSFNHLPQPQGVLGGAAVLVVVEKAQNLLAHLKRL
jgi:hypothetical protein